MWVSFSNTREVIKEGHWDSFDALGIAYRLKAKKTLSHSSDTSHCKRLCRSIRTVLPDLMVMKGLAWGMVSPAVLGWAKREAKASQRRRWLPCAVPT